MKIILLLSCLLTINGIYQFELSSISGTNIKINDYKGKKILFVNIATGSTLAPQLKSLEQLHQQFKDKLIIIAVPSNSFGHEPLDDAAIREELTRKYDAHYLVTTKSVVSGYTQLPLYKWLTKMEENGVVSDPVKGDFQKFLISEEGKLIGLFSAVVDPMSEDLRRFITN